MLYANCMPTGCLPEAPFFHNGRVKPLRPQTFIRQSFLQRHSVCAHSPEEAEPKQSKFPSARWIDRMISPFFIFPVFIPCFLAMFLTSINSMFPSFVRLHSIESLLPSINIY